MRYDDPDLQDLLAAEWVLGSLRGAARRRMATLMRTRPALRQRVAAWEAHWVALELNAPRTRPPARVWQRIAQRVRPAPAPRRAWAGWMGAAVTAALAAWLVIAVVPERAPPPMMVAQLADERGQPSLLLSWRVGDGGQRQVQVQVIAHPQMPAGTTWQAWLLRGGDAPAIALGTIGVEPRQTMTVPAAAAAALDAAREIAVSVEPKGATGGPSLPFLFIGPALRVDG
jgi:anti-sigma-K factor RskA